MPHRYEIPAVGGPGVSVVMLDLSAVPAIDATGLVSLEAALARLHAMHVLVVLAGVQEQPARALAKAGVRAGSQSAARPPRRRSWPAATRALSPPRRPPSARREAGGAIRGSLLPAHRV
jgi:MFS superfamily sulfate permease-like transporter